MSQAAATSAHVDAQFATWGVAAVYAPPGGGAVAPCRIVIAAPDALAEFGEARAVIPTRIVKVRASEIAAPAEGGVFTVEGESFRILAAPRRRDPMRLIWTCGTS